MRLALWESTPYVQIFDGIKKPGIKAGFFDWREA